MLKQGKLIVIEGGDGSGKTIQAKMLVDYLKNQGHLVMYIDFPQYKTFHGRTVAKFLRGEFGNIDQVSPYLISLAYALDRTSIKKEMDQFLAQGGFIIANRYATSNMAHQTAKFKTEKEQNEYLDWIYELEYKVNEIPKEDIVIFLYVPWQVGLALTKKKGQRKYLKDQVQDIHEKDINYRIQSEKMYLKLFQKFKHWVKIECVNNDKLLSPEKIHQKIIQELQNLKIIRQPESQNIDKS